DRYLLQALGTKLIGKHLPPNHPGIPKIKSEKTWHAFLRAIFAAKFPHLTEEEREARAQATFDAGETAALEQRNSFAQAFMNFLRVCSLSDRPNSVIMWSHYCAQHTGICIEYTLKGLPHGHPARRYLYPVSYGTQRFDIAPFGVPLPQSSPSRGL